jgi:hypothetical protein
MSAKITENFPNSPPRESPAARIAHGHSPPLIALTFHDPIEDGSPACLPRPWRSGWSQLRYRVFWLRVL